MQRILHYLEHVNSCSRCYIVPDIGCEGKVIYKKNPVSLTIFIDLMNESTTAVIVLSRKSREQK